MIRCFIGLGSNLDGPRTRIQQALARLAADPDLSPVCASRLYGSQPMGPADQPDYINAVIGCHTRLTPEQLLLRLQAIEQEQGRRRDGARWGPRTLDLDLLLYGDHCQSTPELTLPHYGLAQRAFVLYPLAELAPDLVLPCGTPLAKLLTQVSPDGLYPLMEDAS